MAGWGSNGHVRAVPAGTKPAPADDLHGSDAVDVHGALKGISASLWEISGELDGFDHTGVGLLAHKLCREIQKLVGIIDLIVEERAR